MGEITPIRAFNSKTKDDNEELSGAPNALDLDFVTKSTANPDELGETWFKLEFDTLYCVEKTMRFSETGVVHETISCTPSDCNTCEGSWCFTQNLLEVKSERSSAVLSPVATCKHPLFFSSGAGHKPLVTTSLWVGGRPSESKGLVGGSLIHLELGHWVAVARCSALGLHAR